MKLLALISMAILVSVTAGGDFYSCMKPICVKVQTGNPALTPEENIIKTTYTNLGFDFKLCRFTSAPPSTKPVKFTCQNPKLPDSNVGFACVKLDGDKNPIGKNLCFYLLVPFDPPSVCIDTLLKIGTFLTNGVKECDKCGSSGCRRRRSAARFPGFDVSF